MMNCVKILELKFWFMNWGYPVRTIRLRGSSHVSTNILKLYVQLHTNIEVVKWNKKLSTAIYALQKGIGVNEKWMKT